MMWPFLKENRRDREFLTKIYDEDLIKEVEAELEAGLEEPNLH